MADVNPALVSAAQALQAEALRPSPPAQVPTPALLTDDGLQDTWLSRVRVLYGEKVYQAKRRELKKLRADTGLTFTDLVRQFVTTAAAAGSHR